MWYRKQYSSAAVAGTLGLLILLQGSNAYGAVLDVCPTCTHTTLDAAFAAAAAGDTIVLDGDIDDANPATDYTLATDLVIDATKDGLTIRGETAVRPDKIRVIGTGAGPVVTVEEGFSFTMQGFTVTGGSTGVLAMKDSSVTIRRSMIEGISGTGVDCIEPEGVSITGSVVTGCGVGAKLDIGGTLDVVHSTFLTNTGLAVDSVAGLAKVSACLIHDSGAGLGGTNATLEVAGNWVTDLAGAALPLPAGVTDAYEITDLLDPMVVFEQDPLLNPFPGDIDLVYALPRTGQPSTAFTGVTFIPRDFSNVTRNLLDVGPGADENDVAVTAATWLECYLVQRGGIRSWVGEGPLTIELTVENVSLENSALWIGNEAETGIAVDNNVTPNRIGPLAVTTPSVVDTNFGLVDYTIDRDVFVAAFPALMGDVDRPNYEIFIVPDGELLGDTAMLDDPEAAGGQAELGRFFGLDTEPPVLVTNRNFLADQYATAASLADGGPIDAGPWAAGLPLLGDAGANAGYMNYAGGDPSIFFDGPTPKPNMGIALTFTDMGSGFETNGLPNGRIETTPVGKRRALYTDYENVPGMAWWDPNSESTVELINTVSPTADLTVTYTNTGGNTLEAAWNFSGLLHDLTTQWHAIANIRVTDLAGNEATLDPSFATFIPLKPLHLWWFPTAKGELRGGPAGNEVTDPVFTWGLFRGAGGQDPKDPLPCFSTVRWRLWRAVSPGAPGTAWVDLTGGNWSLWMNPNVKTISRDTLFGTIAGSQRRLGDLMVDLPGIEDEYLIAVQGYDEAGNLQDVSGLPASPVENDFPFNGIDHRRWTDPGADASLALDTKVQARFWYNPGVGGRDRTIDGGDRDFGAATRIPLPPADACQRVEAGFTVNMDLPGNASAAAAGVYYELFEDGRIVASGTFSPAGVVPGAFHFVIPSDLMLSGANVPPWLIPSDDVADDLFLNRVPGCSGIPDRLGDDGPAGAEPPYRQRDVKYQLLLATQVGGVRDRTPATVEFVVSAAGASSTASDDQPVKYFSK